MISSCVDGRKCEGKKNKMIRLNSASGILLSFLTLRLACISATIDVRIQRDRLSGSFLVATGPENLAWSGLELSQIDVQIVCLNNGEATTRFAGCQASIHQLSSLESPEREVLMEAISRFNGTEEELDAGSYQVFTLPNSSDLATMSNSLSWGQEPGEFTLIGPAIGDDVPLMATFADLVAFVSSNGSVQMNSRACLSDQERRQYESALAYVATMGFVSIHQQGNQDEQSSDPHPSSGLQHKAEPMTRLANLLIVSHIETVGQRIDYLGRGAHDEPLKVSVKQTRQLQAQYRLLRVVDLPANV